MGRWNAELVSDARRSLDGRSVVLVGLMGCGKSTVGRRLATALSQPFADADAEIELAAQKSIPEIFEDHGESYFRDGERRVIRRLLRGPQHVLATGGGAFMDPRTRGIVRDEGVSIWLKADLQILLKRVARRNHRPLLNAGDPKVILRGLIDERHPIYGLSDVTIESRDVTHDAMVTAILRALRARATEQPAQHLQDTPAT